MKITSIVVDDDIDNRFIISNYISKTIDKIINIGEAGSVAEAISLIECKKPDLLILDINLPDGNAFDLLADLKNKEFEVIFITAFDKYAVEAFKFSAIDYLLKPISFSDLDIAFDKILEKIKYRQFYSQFQNFEHNLKIPNKFQKRIAIPNNNGFLFVEQVEIIRLESEGNYTNFFLSNGKKILSSYNLGHYVDLLSEDCFFRIHNSSIVNLEFVENFNRVGSGGTVILKDGNKLIVSQRRKDAFLNKILNR